MGFDIQGYFHSLYTGTYWNILHVNCMWEISNIKSGTSNMHKYNGLGEQNNSEETAQNHKLENFNPWLVLPCIITLDSAD